MKLEEAMADLREHFGLRPEDLNIDLGPLGHLLPPERGEAGPEPDQTTARQRQTSRNRRNRERQKGAPSVNDDAK
jgi:hypothetical protein